MDASVQDPVNWLNLIIVIMLGIERILKYALKLFSTLRGSACTSTCCGGEASVAAELDKELEDSIDSTKEEDSN